MGEGVQGGKSPERVAPLRTLNTHGQWDVGRDTKGGSASRHVLEPRESEGEADQRRRQTEKGRERQSENEGYYWRTSQISHTYGHPIACKWEIDATICISLCFLISRNVFEPWSTLQPSLAVAKRGSSSMKFGHQTVNTINQSERTLFGAQTYMFCYQLPKPHDLNARCGKAQYTRTTRDQQDMR